VGKEDAKKSANQYEVLYESGSDESSIDTKQDYGLNDAYKEEEMEFTIPTCYNKVHEETAFSKRGGPSM
jgi:hypothetical protein